MNRKDYNMAVRSLSDKIYAFALKFIGDEEVAKDMVQDAYERLWINLDKIEAGKAKSFLYKTVYRLCVDYSRKVKVRLKYEQENIDSTYATPENEFFDTSEHLNAALATLPEIQRSVLLLRDLEGYTYEQIGEITGLNESQVKVYIYRARKAVKNYFEKLEKVK